MDKTLTPLRQEIERQQKHLDFLLGYKDYMFEKSKQISSAKSTILCLQSLLPAEREFAEKMFEGGVAWGRESSINYDTIEPDFTTLFKSYEDGE